MTCRSIICHISRADWTPVKISLIIDRPGKYTMLVVLTCMSRDEAKKSRKQNAFSIEERLIIETWEKKENDVGRKCRFCWESLPTRMSLTIRLEHLMKTARERPDERGKHTSKKKKEKGRKTIERIDWYKRMLMFDQMSRQNANEGEKSSEKERMLLFPLVHKVFLWFSFSLKDVLLHFRTLMASPVDAFKTNLFGHLKSYGDAVQGVFEQRIGKETFSCAVDCLVFPWTWTLFWFSREMPSY